MDFDNLYQTYWDKIYRLCMGYLNQEEEARDMAQETFVIVWQKLPQFRGEAAISTWIYRIAVNKCLRQIKRKKPQTSYELPFQIAEDSIAEDRKEQLVLLRQFIAELPEIDRIIIALELDEVPQGEIAVIVGLSDVNIRVRLHRIKVLLTKKFKEHGC